VKKKPGGHVFYHRVTVGGTGRKLVKHWIFFIFFILSQGGEHFVLNFTLAIITILASS